MYSTDNEGKSVVARRFIRTLKSKIYKKMTTENRKPYFGYLNQLVDDFNNSYIVLLVKNLLVMIILLWLKKLRRIPKLLNLKLMIESELLRTRISTNTSKG